MATVWLGTAAVDGAGEDAHVDAAQVYRDYVARQAPTLAMVNHMLEVCEKRGDGGMARHLAADLDAFGLVPNYHSFAFLVGAHGRAGDLPRMQEAFDRMYLSSTKPDMHVIATAIFHYGRRGDAEGVIAMYLSAMTGGRCEPDLRPDACTGSCARRAAEPHSAARVQSGPGQHRLEHWQVGVCVVFGRSNIARMASGGRTVAWPRGASA